jgi:hypothetical protein
MSTQAISTSENRDSLACVLYRELQHALRVNHAACPVC